MKTLNQWRIALIIILILWFRIGAEAQPAEKQKHLSHPTYYQVVVHYKVKTGLSIARIYTNQTLTFYTSEVICTPTYKEVDLIGAYNDAGLKYKIADFVEIRKTTSYDQHGEWVEKIEVSDPMGKAIPDCNW